MPKDLFAENQYKWDSFPVSIDDDQKNVTKTEIQNILASGNRSDSPNIFSIPRQFVNDPDVMLWAASNNPKLLTLCGKDLSENVTFGLKVLKKSKLDEVHIRYNYLPHTLKVDHQIAELAASLSSRTGIFLPTELHHDIEIGKTLVKTRCKRNLQYGFPEEAFEHIPETLRSKREIALFISKQNLAQLNMVFENFRNDYEIVQNFAARNFSTLKYASERLQDDYEIVKLAVQHDIVALESASERLKNNPDIVMTSLMKYGNSMQYAGQKFKADRDIVAIAMLQTPGAFKHASEALRDDTKLAEIAIADEGCNLKYCSERLQGDRQLVLKAVSQNGVALQWADVALQSDSEIFKAALKQTAKAIFYTQPPTCYEPKLLIKGFERHIHEMSPGDLPDHLLNYLEDLSRTQLTNFWQKKEPLIAALKIEQGRREAVALHDKFRKLHQSKQAKTTISGKTSLETTTGSTSSKKTGKLRI